MLSNLLPQIKRVSLLALALGALAASAQGQAGCPDSLPARVGRAWASYHADSLDTADADFRAAAQCGSLSAVTGLGFVALRRGQLARADSLFSVVLGRDSSQVDAWEGLARSAWRRADLAATARAAKAALQLAPDRADLRALLNQAAPDGDRPPLPPRRRPVVLALPARTIGEGFEVRDSEGRWVPFYLQGVNLGVALPGTSPPSSPPTPRSTPGGSTPSPP